MVGLDHDGVALAEIAQPGAGRDGGAGRPEADIVEIVRVTAGLLFGLFFPDGFRRGRIFVIFRRIILQSFPQ
jgi:hypothetical protein